MAHHPQGAFKLTVRMQRDSPNIPWGFRLQGGADFPNIPLSIAKVNPGSLAEEVGLQPGDIITAIGDPPNPAIHWSHGEAEQVIRQCLDYLVLTVQRGGGRVWEVGRAAAADVPSAAPTARFNNNAAATISAALPGSSKYMGGPSPQYQQQTSYNNNNNHNNDTYVQHSLAANRQDYNPTGQQFNRSARPFGGQQQGGTIVVAGGQDNTPPIIHNTYNSPMGLYSASNAQQAFDSQANALLGSRQTGPSPTMQAVNQYDKYGDQVGGNFGQSAAAYNGGAGAPSGYPSGGYGNNGVNQNRANGAGPGGYRPVQAPQTMSPEHYQTPVTTPPTCTKCGSSIVGVFVRVRGNPMCVACYTCARCHIPLKTIGHFIINDQLYCEQHAKEASRPGYGGYQSQTVWS